MNNPQKLCTLLALFASTSLFGATVDINFDDLPGDGVVPGNYDGLTWSSAWYYYGETQPPYNPSSPPNRVYVQDSNETIDFGQAVTFLGSYFSGYGYSDPYWVGYDENGNVIDTGAAVSPSGTPTFDSLDWSGVWSVGLFSSDPDYFTVDDIQYSTGASTPDASSTLLLLGVGLAGLLLLRGKRLVA